MERRVYIQTLRMEEALAHIYKLGSDLRRCLTLVILMVYIRSGEFMDHPVLLYRNHCNTRPLAILAGAGECWSPTTSGGRQIANKLDCAD